MSVARAAPMVGDRVVKRGLGHKGTVQRASNGWCWIDWDLGRLSRERPEICAYSELEVIIADPMT